MSEYKDHHYVSEFILRNFSDDGKQINVYLCKEGKIKKFASISKQFKKKYLCGHVSFDIERKLFANRVVQKLQFLNNNRLKTKKNVGFLGKPTFFARLVQ